MCGWMPSRSQTQGRPAGRGSVQFQLQIRRARCGAILDAQDEVIAVFAQIQVGVAPGVQVGAAVQCLSGRWWRWICQRDGPSPPRYESTGAVSVYFGKISFRL